MLYIVCYILTTATSVILLHFIGGNIEAPKILIIFLSTTYAIILFNLLNHKNLGGLYIQLFKTHKLKYLGLNLSILITWLGTFLIPIYFMPSTLLITFMSVVSICGATSIYLNSKKNTLLIKVTLLALNLILFYLGYMIIYSKWLYVIFVISTLITGLSGFAYLKISEIFFKDSFNSIQILAVRFWALWLILLVWTIYDHQLSQFKVSILPNSLLIGLTSLILPVYFLQKSIEKIGSNNTSIFMGITPVAVVAMEYAFLESGFSLSWIYSIVLCLIIVSFGVYQSILAKKRIKNVL